MKKIPDHIVTELANCIAENFEDVPRVYIRTAGYAPPEGAKKQNEVLVVGISLLENSRPTFDVRSAARLFNGKNLEIVFSFVDDTPRVSYYGTYESWFVIVHVFMGVNRSKEMVLLPKFIKEIWERETGKPYNPEYEEDDGTS